MIREIEQNMILSTGHISEKDNSLLEYSNRNARINNKFDPYPFKVIENGGEGWILYVPEEAEFGKRNNTKAYLDELATGEQTKEDKFYLDDFSNEFIDLLHLAQENGCVWLTFDNGCGIDDELPTFKW